jgi:hypothetical protein
MLLSFRRPLDISHVFNEIREDSRGEGPRPGSEPDGVLPHGLVSGPVVGLLRRRSSKHKWLKTFDLWKTKRHWVVSLPRGARSGSTLFCVPGQYSYEKRRERITAAGSAAAGDKLFGRLCHELLQIEEPGC